MKISDMISELQLLQADIGDVEILISDGFRSYHYRGNYNVRRYNENGQTYVDIGIGGCLEEDDGIL